MLLDDIITILSDENGSLNSALLKTKVLLHTLGKKDLATWVTNELKGYPEGTDVPEYRIVNCSVHGHVTSIAWQMADTQLPIRHLSDEQQKSLTTQRCQLSIGSIEEAVRAHRTKGSGLMRPLPLEYSIFFKKALQPGVEVIRAWCDISMMDVENILAEVRSRLLDFCLELRDVVGTDISDKELAAKAASLDTEKMFSTNIMGSGNTIIIGSQGIQTITNQKDDIEGLISAVGKLGFQQQELDQLRQSVIDDKAAGKQPDLSEGKTGKWFVEALKKAGKGVVKGGIDVVSTVIVKAMKAYTDGAP